MEPVQTPSAGPSDSILSQFAQRVATRDDLAAAPPLNLTPEGIRQRLGQGLGTRLGTRDPRRWRTLGHIAYALMQAEWQTNAQLATATGHSAQAMQRVADGLVHPGWLDVRYDKNTRVQRLTRAGQDLLLALAQGTLT